MYRRKAGRAVEVEEDLDNEEGEDSDPELVEMLDDGDLDTMLGRPVTSTPSVKKGKGKVFNGTAQVTAKRKPSRSRRGTGNIQAPPKGRRIRPISPVEESESEQEDFSALLNVIGATSTDKDGVPYLSSASQLPQSPIKRPISKKRPWLPVKRQGAGRNRGFATTSKSKLALVQETFDSDEVEDFTLGLNNISDTSMEQ